jgi:hypothetical protein
MRDTSVNGLPLLSKLKIPLVIICGIIFAMEVVSAFMRGFYLDKIDFKVQSQVANMAGFLKYHRCDVYYCWCCRCNMLLCCRRKNFVQITQKFNLQNSQTVGCTKESNFYLFNKIQITTLIILSAVGLIMFLIGWIGLITIGVDGPTVCGLSWLIFLGLSFVSLCQSLVFVVPKTTPSYTESPNKTPKNLSDSS